MHQLVALRETANGGSGRTATPTAAPKVVTRPSPCLNGYELQELTFNLIHGVDHIGHLQ
jgi:hypothetical protein